MQQQPYAAPAISAQDMLGVLRQMYAQNQAQAQVNAETLASLKGMLEDVRKASQQKAAEGAVPRFIEDIPGKRVPYTWVITVNYDSAISNGTRKSGSATLSQDGPFVVTTYKAFWQPTTLTSGEDADIQNVFLPPGRMPWIIRAATAVPVIPRDALDFTVSLQLSGGDRLWQNTDSPAIAFYDAVRPYYLGVPGLIERNETLTVQTTVQVSTTAGNSPDSSARGTFWFICDGYKILRPIDYAESQGWTR